MIRSDPPTPVGNGGFRAADEAGVPTIPNPAAKLAQLPEALVAARAVIAAGDAINLPAPVILGQLMLLKRRYRWINSFRADPTGPTTWRFTLLASSFPLVTADLGDPLVLFHGTSNANARALATAMRDPRQGFVSTPIEHDIGEGLYLFEDALGAAHYAGRNGTVIRLEIPRPHPDEIADIGVHGIAANGLPGAQREMFMDGADLHGVIRAEHMHNPALAMPELSVETLPPIHPLALDNHSKRAKVFTRDQSRDAASPFGRNLARAQLFAGKVPPHAELMPGGLGFEFDIIQWRMRAPTDDVRRQIIAQIFGP